MTAESWGEAAGRCLATQGCAPWTLHCSAVGPQAQVLQNIFFTEKETISQYLYYVDIMCLMHVKKPQIKPRIPKGSSIPSKMNLSPSSYITDGCCSGESEAIAVSSFLSISHALQNAELL